VRGRIHEFSDLSGEVIRCAIEVHREIGPGLLESTYRRCLAHELRLNGIDVTVEEPVSLQYKGLAVRTAYRMDLFVEQEIIVEIKSVATLADAHHQQLLTYMRHKRIRKGFLMNCVHPRLMDGLVSLVL
jgi:GxxExxY protein